MAPVHVRRSAGRPSPRTSLRVAPGAEPPDHFLQPAIGPHQAAIVIGPCRVRPDSGAAVGRQADEVGREWAVGQHRAGGGRPAVPIPVHGDDFDRNQLGLAGRVAICQGAGGVNEPGGRPVGPGRCVWSR